MDGTIVNSHAMSRIALLFSLGISRVKKPDLATFKLQPYGCVPFNQTDRISQAIVFGAVRIVLGGSCFSLLLI